MEKLPCPQLVVAALLEIDLPDHVPEYIGKEIIYYPFINFNIDSIENLDPVSKKRITRAITKVARRLVRKKLVDRQCFAQGMQCRLQPIAYLGRRPRPERKKHKKKH